MDGASLSSANALVSLENASKGALRVAFNLIDDQAEATDGLVKVRPDGQ